MNNCRAVYIGDGNIATNFYALTDTQKAKRKLLGKKEAYDIIPLDKIKRIIEKCETIHIVGLNHKISPYNYMFSYLMDNRVNMHKVTTDLNKLTFSTTNYDTDMSKETIEKIFENNEDFKDKFIDTSNLVIMALKGLYNLYWKTGRVDKWEEVYKLSKSNCTKFEKYIQEKYNIDHAQKILRQKDKEYIIEADIEDREELKKLRRYSQNGFRVDMSSSIQRESRGHGAFLFSFEGNMPEYLELNSNEYYLVTLTGIHYPLRLLYNSKLEETLRVCGVKSLEEFSAFDKRERKIKSLYSRIKKLNDKGIDLEASTNKMLSWLVMGLCCINEDMNFYECDNQTVTWAVKKEEDLTEVLKRLNEVMETLNIKHCFDAVLIQKSLTGPGSIMSWETKNPKRLDINHLININNVEYFVNGCDNQQVTELFNNLRQ